MKQIQDARDEAAEMEEAAKKASADAKKLHGYLGNTNIAAPVRTAPTGSSPSTNVVTALGKARKATDGEGKEEMAHVLVQDTKGEKVNGDLPTAELLSGIVTRVR